MSVDAKRIATTYREASKTTETSELQLTMGSTLDSHCNFVVFFPKFSCSEKNMKPVCVPNHSWPMPIQMCCGSQRSSHNVRNAISSPHRSICIATHGSSNVRYSMNNSNRKVNVGSKRKRSNRNVTKRRREKSYEKQPNSKRSRIHSNDIWQWTEYWSHVYHVSSTSIICNQYQLASDCTCFIIMY